MTVDLFYDVSFHTFACNFIYPASNILCISSLYQITINARTWQIKSLLQTDKENVRNSFTVEIMWLFPFKYKQRLTSKRELKHLLLIFRGSRCIYNISLSSPRYCVNAEHPKTTRLQTLMHLVLKRSEYEDKLIWFMFLLVLGERDYLSAYMHVDAHECIMWQRKYICNYSLTTQLRGDSWYIHTKQEWERQDILVAS